MSRWSPNFRKPPRAGRCLLTALLVAAPVAARAQTAEQPIGSLLAGSSMGVKVSGAVTLDGARTLLGNGSSVGAGAATLPVTLTRGGRLDLCANTTVHLSQQYNPADPRSPLLIALDHGAIEAHYRLDKNSDVVLTPDLRILLSGPGSADVRIRVNQQGDTCVSNRGHDAPYVTVSEQMGTGVYRVQSGQRVLFEHGSVRSVVDNEAQPCGCPAQPVVVVAPSGQTTMPQHAAKAGQAVAAKNSSPGGPSSTPADTAFPLAESEGLVPAPKMPASPALMPGEEASQISTTLSYIAPRQSVPTGLPNGVATPESAATTATTPVPGFGPSVNTGPAPGAQPVIAIAPVVAKKKKPGFLHAVGRFFARIFG